MVERKHRIQEGLEPRREASGYSFDSCIQLPVRASMFWRPVYVEFSAWIEHVPFAFWLIDMHKPATLVELGTYYGTSYFAFCQAVSRLDLGARCFAVDTWEGDDHTGTYGPEVLAKVQAHNDAQYSSFSRLVRTTFDESAGHFSNESIDLIHIDGFHTYDAVRHDFETWLPKMSRRGIMLFHDTNVRERNFGVYRLLEELRSQYPVFEFFHGHGLGVVAVGDSHSDVLARLFDMADDADVSSVIRDMFGNLGMACHHGMRLREHERIAVERNRKHKHAQNEYTKQLHEKTREIGALRAELDKQAREIYKLKADVGAKNQQLFDLRHSLSWALTAPLRSLGRIWLHSKRTRK